MTDSTLTRGGCLCGAVRYMALGNPRVVAFCHCPSCRRFLAAPLTAWAMFDHSNLEFENGEPQRYASSTGVERTFYGRCGTALTIHA